MNCDVYVLICLRIATFFFVYMCVCLSIYRENENNNKCITHTLARTHGRAESERDGQTYGWMIVHGVYEREKKVAVEATTFKHLRIFGTFALF